MKKDDRIRLFEVMQRLDKTFKPTLNEEDSYSDYLDTNYSADGLEDANADNESQKQAEMYYDLGQETFKLANNPLTPVEMKEDFLNKANQLRAIALNYGSSLGWGDNELPPYQ